MIELGGHSYGKSAIRLVTVRRDGGRHELRDRTVSIELVGDFATAHTSGDNSAVIATDTMKNTTYAFAADDLDAPSEALARRLAEHFAAADQVATASVTIAQHPWDRIAGPGGSPAPDAFVRDGSYTRTCRVVAGADGTTVTAGLDGLTVMKTGRSAFSGFPCDEYTTLAETDDRLLATRVAGSWRYGAGELDFDRLFDAVRSTFLEAFADHDSRSVQETIWIVARAILERHAQLEEVTLTMPNLHHWLVDLDRFGRSNDRAVYVSTTEPYGLIEATVRRG